VKIVKNAYKAWSTWTAGLLVVLLSAEQAMPLIAARIPEHVYDWAVWGLALAIPILRFIDQGLPKNEDNY